MNGIGQESLIQHDLSRVEARLDAVSSRRDLERTRLKQATEDFESIFVKQMLDSMRKTVKKGDLFGGGFAETIYEDMLYERYADRIAESGTLGIAKMLYERMSEYV